MKHYPLTGLPALLSIGVILPALVDPDPSRLYAEMLLLGFLFGFFDPGIEREEWPFEVDTRVLITH